MPSRELAHLCPRLRPVVFDLLHRAREAAMPVFVTCTWRSNREQADLYSSGRTAPGAILTHAKPGESYHNFEKDGKPAAKATDVAFVMPPAKGLYLGPWEALGKLGESLGLVWGGRWPGAKKDKPHFQCSGRCDTCRF